MSFYIPSKARNWFHHVQGPKGSNTGLELDFDIYYFCLVVGLSSKRKLSLANSETTEIIQRFPNEFKDRRHLIVALFLKVELETLGISLNERNTLDNELKRLIDPTSPTNLSDVGIKEMNKYSFAGFEKLQTYFTEPPRTLDNFLLELEKLINEKNTYTD